MVAKKTNSAGTHRRRGRRRRKRKKKRLALSQQKRKQFRDRFQGETEDVVKGTQLDHWDLENIPPLFVLAS
jgi:hypothetical protein